MPLYKLTLCFSVELAVHFWLPILGRNCSEREEQIHTCSALCLPTHLHLLSHILFHVILTVQSDPSSCEKSFPDCYYLLLKIILKIKRQLKSCWYPYGL